MSKKNKLSTRVNMVSSPATAWRLPWPWPPANATAASASLPLPTAPHSTTPTATLQHSARLAKEKEDAANREAKLAHKKERLAAAEKMGVAAPKRLKRKAKKGMRLRKHVVVRVRKLLLRPAAGGPGRGGLWMGCGWAVGGPGVGRAHTCARRARRLHTLLLGRL